MASFPSIEEALDGIAACLSPLTTRVHTGSAGTGETLDCCPDPLLRIETSGTRAKDGLITVYMLGRGRCRDVLLDITITYLSCFASFDGDSANAAAIADTTAQGRAVIRSWTEALNLIASDVNLNQLVRFSSEQDLPPDGACAGWVLRLEADVACCT